LARNNFYDIISTNFDNAQELRRIGEGDANEEKQN
jgi:hypothetical protein